MDLFEEIAQHNMLVGDNMWIMILLYAKGVKHEKEI